MQAKNRIRWRAVVAGSLLDQILTIIIGGIGLSVAPDIAYGQFFSSMPSTVIGVLLGLATVVGGWLAGRIAKEERFLHGLMVGGVGIVLLLLDSAAGGNLTLDMMVLQFVATGLAGFAGYSSGWVTAGQRK